MAELPINVIIIAILVVLVLVIVAAFFTGGFSQIIEKIKGTTSGISVDDAILRCQTLCNTYKTTQRNTAKETFCNSHFEVDLNADGKIEGHEKEVYCDELGVDCGIDCREIRG